MNTHILLWSRRQNAVHIETVDAALAAGRQAYRDEAITDYVPLLIGTLDEVSAAAEGMRPTLVKRDERRRTAA